MTTAEALMLYEGAMLALSLNGGGGVLGVSEPAIDGALELYAGSPRKVERVDATPKLCRWAIVQVGDSKGLGFECMRNRRDFLTKVVVRD